MEDKLERLKTVRSKIDEIKQSKSRIAGELDGYNNRIEELKKSCKEQYDVDIEELPEIIKGLETEIESELAKAEKLLGL